MAMAAALEQGADWLAAATGLRRRLDEAMGALGAELVAAQAPRLATIGAYRVPGMSAAALLIRLDALGLAISAGSACSSGSLKPSHVLAAMHIDAKAASEVFRISFGRETKEADVDTLLDALGKVRVSA
jgi:cysteine desulfurase